MRPPWFIRPLLALVLALPLLSFAQQKPQRWGGGVDDETLHFGFSFHYINADYKIALKPSWRESFMELPDSLLTGVSSPFSQGVGLGLLADLKLTENVNLRFTPNLVFSNIDVNYQYDQGALITKTVHRSNIDLPLFLKFKSDRKNNYRGYLIAGGKYSINVASSKRYDDRGSAPLQKELKTIPGYFSYEAGIGFDVYFDFFKMSPEIRWSQSIGDVLDRRDDNMFNHPIERMTLRSFQISLFFE